MKRKLVFIGILGGIVLAAAMIWIAGGALSAPVNQSIGEPPTGMAPAGKSVEAVEFLSESGTVIHGWFIQGQQRGGAVVLMHGVRANRLSMVERAKFLAGAGYSVLLFDFQAHGESLGKNITFGYLESRDARAAVVYTRSRLPQEKIGVIGISMGGAAVLLAQPKLEIDAAVLEMVYPAIEQAVANRITIRLGSWSKILTPFLTWQLKPRLGISVDEMRPIDHIADINLPKLFIAGAADEHTTLAESEALYNAAAEPKELWIIPNAKHVDLYPLVKEEYEKKVLAFFEKSLRH